MADVEVILNYSEDSSKLQGDKIQKLWTIQPSVPRTAKFVLQPKGCIHKEELMQPPLTNAWIPKQWLLRSIRIYRMVFVMGSKLWAPSRMKCLNK